MNKDELIKYAKIYLAPFVVLFLFLIHNIASGYQSGLKLYISSKYMDQAEKIDSLFRVVYKPDWRGAYGLIGQSYLYKITKDQSYLNFIIKKNIIKLDNGEWVDDVAWDCLAILYWWDVTGQANSEWLMNVKKRYDKARKDKLLKHDDGYWTWYNVKKRIFQFDKRFTNSNMNQMVIVACWLYRATGERKYLNDALLVWNGDNNFPGIEKKLYKGKGKWEGRPGKAAFGAELPFNGAGYLSIGSALYNATQDQKYKKIVIDTAKYILNPKNGWVEDVYFYQKYVDGNGAFVNFLMDAYSIAPNELSDVLKKCKKMLDHVWTNNYGKSKVILHREIDNGIRHGWNPYGGEDGYYPDEIGT
ncbi:MAG: hypothetical protein PHF84_00700, partial [bacterium]|nr:hypothetical protein [bacterium]